MASWTEPRLPSRCDSLRGFHVLRAAALRSSADSHSWFVRPRRLALGSPNHHGHARCAVSGRAAFAKTFPGQRNLARTGVRVVAMADRAGLRRRRSTRWLAVLLRDWARRASAGTSESNSGRLT